MTMKHQNKPHESLLIVKVSPPLSPKNVKDIARAIKTLSASKPLIQMFLSSNHRYYTMIPRTVVAPSANVSKLIRTTLLPKLVIFASQYRLETGVVTIICKLTSLRR